jgi:tripartite-type tricarboxylate transporter receptor subunit TctC
LNRELRAVVESAEVRQKLLDWGGSPQAGSPAEFKARVERDILSMQAVVQNRHIERE